MGLFPNFTQINLITMLSIATSAYKGKFYVDDYQLLYAHKTSTLYFPVFYALSHGNDLYISIRGSQDQPDFDTYEENQEIKTKFGTFHSGYFKAAMNVYSKAYTLLINCKGTIYCVGHSYGGSTSQILAILIKNLIPNSNPLAIAFGPVTCIDPITSEKYKDNIITVINKGDIFPTLTINNFRNLFNQKHPKFLGYINSYQIYSEYKPIIESMNLTGVPIAKQLQSAVLGHLRHQISDALKIGRGKSFDIKYPSGYVYHIGMENVTNIYDCLVDPATEFSTVSMDVNAISSHTPHPYNDTLYTLSYDYKGN